MNYCAPRTPACGRRRNVRNPLHLSPQYKHIVVFLVCAAVAATPGIVAAEQLDLICEVPPTGGLQPDFIEAIQVLDDYPGEILLAVRNQGAGCGGGTPISIWKATLDPTTGECLSVVHKQQLPAIQNVRETLFESSDRTVFSGGGWCGYKPPYYSTDFGETWRRADSGPVHPPNSTFSYAELGGEVYAGTGYNPWPGEVYRWLGGGNWQRVLNVGQVRNIVNELLAHNGLLFVGSTIYVSGGTACAGTVPVYVSSDGNSFTPTTGIPSCFSITGLAAAGDDVVAFANSRADSTDTRVYRWLGGDLAWEEIGSTPWLIRRPAVSEDRIFALGRAPQADPRALYQSTDLGQTWQQAGTFGFGNGSSLAVHEDTVYVGTRHDAADKVYLYRMSLGRPPVADAGLEDVVECTDDQSTRVLLDGSGSYDPDGDPITCEWLFEDGGWITDCKATALLPLGKYPITLVVDDGRNGTAEDTVAKFVQDTLAPDLSGVPEPIHEECSSPAGTPVTVPLPSGDDLCHGPVTVTHDAPAVFPLGITEVTFAASDPRRNQATASTSVTVADATAPEILKLAADPDVLSPPKHQMVSVTVEVVSTDVCDGAQPFCRITGVSSDEPEDGTGEGDTAPDWQITGDLTVDLRAECAERGDGRLYTLAIACEDAAGNAATADVAVTVPQSRRR